MSQHRYVHCPRCSKPRRSSGNPDAQCRDCRFGTPEFRFQNNYRVMPTGCWEWAAYCEPKGYGEFRMNGLKISAHRASWLLNRGPIPENLQVLHGCDNPPCVNPEHLFLGTHQDNMLDMKRKGRARGAGGRGSHHMNARLTETQITEIIRSNLPRTALARSYGVHVTHIGRIKRGERWAHLRRTETVG